MNLSNPIPTRIKIERMKLRAPKPNRSLRRVNRGLHYKNQGARKLQQKGFMSKKPTWPMDAVEYVDKLTVKDIHKLLQLKALFESDSVGNLQVSTIIEFLKTHPSFYAHGYAVDAKDASDHLDHVVIEGVEGDVNVLSELTEFLELFWNATELDVVARHCYAWFQS